MYYHCVAVLGGTDRTHRWWNRTKENLISDLLVPFLNGHVIEGKWKKKSALVNMKAVDHFVVYKTNKKLAKSQVEQFKRDNRIGTDCTSKLLKELSFDKTNEQTKTLLQKLMLPTKHQIFVIMKFDDEELDSAYKGVIRPLGEEFGYKVLRIDEVEDSSRITAQIIERIAESELIIANLTGARPNCYYETGIAFATGKQLILSIKEGEKVHFDLSVHRFIKWRTEHTLRQKLRQRLRSIIEENEQH